eukprot:592790-Prymnesium_polylepis.1
MALAAAPASLEPMGEEQEWMEMQRVEVFERPSGAVEEPWKSIGDGTVMWQQDGSIQRLLVVKGEDTDWIQELACIVLPDPTLAISYLSDENIIYWRNAEMDHEVALSFTSADGCAQVWEDIQLLQSATEHSDFGDGSHYDLADIEAFMGVAGDALHGDGGLPEPSVESLPQLVAILSASIGRPQVLRALELDDTAGERRDDF